MIFLLLDSTTLIEKNQKDEETLRDRLPLGQSLHVVEFISSLSQETHLP